VTFLQLYFGKANLSSAAAAALAKEAGHELGVFKLNLTRAEVGDIVQLKSGGALMTVSKLSNLEKGVKWFSALGSISKEH
jgi:uncharacterized protein YodC (DUF2158 family)